jgi:hypothetical protein
MGFRDLLRRVELRFQSMGGRRERQLKMEGQATESTEDIEKENKEEEDHESTKEGNTEKGFFSRFDVSVFS